MVRITTKIGDVFSVTLDCKSKKYFQYIVNDLTQLNSDVIRVFKKVYPINSTPNLSEVVTCEVDFYAHCITKWGIKLGFWEKVGNITDTGKLDVIFKDTKDYGSKPGEQIKISNNWHVWKVNQEFKYVGKLEGEYQKAEIGIVIDPLSIVGRIRTGKYDFTYPDYK